MWTGVVMFSALTAACVVGLLIASRPRDRRWIRRRGVAEQVAVLALPTPAENA